MSVDLTTDLEAANRSRFHLCSDERHRGHLNCHFTVPHYLHSHYDRFLRKCCPAVKHVLMLTMFFFAFGVSEIVLYTVCFGFSRLELPPKYDPETESSGFLELCPFRLDAKPQDNGPDIF